ncbi:electron transporter RnfB [Spiribacter halobius]|uniref:Electron transporter RnfB n=1 Tax=Sediminicurvatus halobius TaxID=2182432 RepID=A0A2U2MXG1_9GAMM|nr:electron transporter RnfB [Spiribacter halobius]
MTAREPEAPLTERIDALLPQTQCRQCGFAGCRPYAEAIARGEADIDQCPPGGDAGAAALARLLGRTPKPVDRRYGTPGPVQLAWIDEAPCIGCTKCIQACPVDAILGARGQMHTVITEECTGCELCVDPCPVDCIHLVPAGREHEDAATRQARADRARERHRERERRLAERRAEKTAQRERRRAAAARSGVPDRDTRRAAVQAALERVRARRRSGGRTP